MAEHIPTVLVPLGFSEQSLVALDQAVIFAKEMKAKIVMLAVLNNDSHLKDALKNANDKDALKKAAKAKLVEFRNPEAEVTLGEVITSEIFEEGELVDVVGTSKGKGFQGVVKRHGFAGVGDATHGQHNRLRAPGSLGAGSTPSKVMKGMKMAGRMGGDRITQQNLQVVKVYSEKNLIVVKGSVPGAKGSFVLIQK
mgnify:CR=1 FL=1